MNNEVETFVYFNGFTEGERGGTRENIRLRL